MANIRKTFKGGIAMGVMAVGITAAALVVPASPAEAALTNCANGRSGNGWRSICLAGTGLQRVVARCVTPADRVVERHGPWRGVDVFSTAPCAGSEDVIGGFTERQV